MAAQCHRMCRVEHRHNHGLSAPLWRWPSYLQDRCCEDQMGQRLGFYSTNEKEVTLARPASGCSSAS